MIQLKKDISQFEESFFKEVSIFKESSNTFNINDNNDSNSINELVTYCYNVLLENNIVCKKDGWIGRIHYTELFGEKIISKISNYEMNKVLKCDVYTIVIWFRKGEYIIGGDILVYENTEGRGKEKYKSQIEPYTHLLIDGGIHFNIDTYEGYGEYGFLEISFRKKERM